MSKTNKNQKSITSFFKNPGQPAASKPKSPVRPAESEQQIKREVVEENAPPPLPVPVPTPAASAPKKPMVMVPPAITHVREPTHETEWINLSDRFLLTNRNFDVQYAHLYAERLGSMRKFVAKAAENRWGQ